MYVGRHTVTAYIAAVLFVPNRWESTDGTREGDEIKKKQLRFRKISSVTIKVMEVVLIKQDTWRRGEQMMLPPAATSCIHMHYSAHSTAVQVAQLSLDMYTTLRKK